jgi:Flp pilus assembly protein TadD
VSFEFSARINTSARATTVLAEKHFRAAVEKHPRDAEAWIGLAASYDRLRRFDLADRAYGQAVGIVGPTVEILNNQGFSYMLRGDYKRAHAALAAAQRKDPATNTCRTICAARRELSQGQERRIIRRHGESRQSGLG